MMQQVKEIDFVRLYDDTNRSLDRLHFMVFFGYTRNAINPETIDEFISKLRFYISNL